MQLQQNATWIYKIINSLNLNLIKNNNKWGNDMHELETRIIDIDVDNIRKS